jgi:3-hydroxyacyl-CoA dehydrogenase
MWYADAVGLKPIYERVSDFHRQLGDIWQPAPLLKRLAEQGKTFTEFGKEESAAA